MYRGSQHNGDFGTNAKSPMGSVHKPKLLKWGDCVSDFCTPGAQIQWPEKVSHSLCFVIVLILNKNLFTAMYSYYVLCLNLCTSQLCPKTRLAYLLHQPRHIHGTVSAVWKHTASPSKQQKDLEDGEDGDQQWDRFLFEITFNIKPNYFKKQSSSSSFLLTYWYIIQIRTGLEYSAGQFHASNAWNLPVEYSIAILNLYYIFPWVS